MTALTNDDIYGYDLGDPGPVEDWGGGSSGMAGVTLNGTHTVEQTGKHVAAIALVALVVLFVLNRAGIQATVAAHA